jgi:DNA topoisomerase-1
VLNGRYGPYITDGTKNAKIPKDQEPKALSLEQCQKLLAEAPARGARGGKKKKTAAAKPAPLKQAAARKKSKTKATKKKAKKKAKKKTARKTTKKTKAS